MSLQLAEQFESNEQYEQAFEEYKKEYNNSPDDLGILERLGHLALILEKKDEAAGYYYEILKRDVSNSLAYEQLMTIFENTDKYKYYIYRGNKNSLEGKLDFAINDFKKALAHANEDDTQVIMTRLTLANLYRQTGNIPKAIDEYNIIIEYDNLHEDIFLQLADIYLQDEAYSSAIDALLRAKQKGFNSDRISEALATIYLKSGDAKSAIEATKDELLKIQCMLELGEVSQAYMKLKNLPEEYKNLPKYFTLQAQYCYSSKDFEKALEYIEEYNKAQPNSPLTYQMKALVYDETGDEYHAHLNWARYNLLRGNRDIAVNEFLNAVQLRADDVNVMFTLADLLTEDGDVDHASEYYEKIIKIEPSNKEALRKLANYRESLGDYRTQVKYLEKLVEVDSKDLDSLKLLAKSYEKVRANDKAIEIYSKYLELVKDPVEYKMAKDRLDKLSSLGSGDAEESVGLIDRIMKLFNK
ncbi:tetratricopeptide repeat protein [bacterium]|nr:tetratricopeptide repeat protein [bacterium]